MGAASIPQDFLGERRFCHAIPVGLQLRKNFRFQRGLLLDTMKRNKFLSPMVTPRENENILEQSEALPRNPKSNTGGGAIFTRSLLLISVLMFGIIIGMKLSDYFHSQGPKGGGAGTETVELAQGEIKSPTEPASVATQPNPFPGTTPELLANLNYSGGSGISGGAGDETVQKNWADLEALSQERELLNKRYESVMGSSRPPTSSAAGTSLGSDPGLGSGNSLGSASNLNSGSSLSSDSDSIAIIEGEALALAEAARRDKLAADGGGSSRPLLPPGSSSSKPLLPPSSKNSDAITAPEKRVRDAPSLAKVTEYNQDYQFIVLDGGARRNLSVGSKLAVRRGHDVLGLVEVEDVFEDESSAKLTGPWAVKRDMPRPQVGDDLIQWPLF